MICPRYIIANWKMQLSLKEITNWFSGFNEVLPTLPENKTVIIAASQPYLGLLAEITRPLGIKLASQDVSLLDKGAHTGSTGIFQLKDFCKYSLIGHSELGENFNDSIKKRDKCLDNELTPIICFAKLDLAQQVYKQGSIPVWEDPVAISNGGAYQAKPLETIAQEIETIRRFFPTEAPLIYGGSVNRDNIDGLALMQGLDGILPGKASLDPVHFADLVVRF